MNHDNTKISFEALLQMAVTEADQRDLARLPSNQEMNDAFQPSQRLEKKVEKRCTSGRLPGGGAQRCGGRGMRPWWCWAFGWCLPGHWCRYRLYSRRPIPRCWSGKKNSPRCLSPLTAQQ